MHFLMITFVAIVGIILAVAGMTVLTTTAVIAMFSWSLRKPTKKDSKEARGRYQERHHQIKGWVRARNYGLAVGALCFLALFFVTDGFRAIP